MKKLQLLGLGVLLSFFVVTTAFGKKEEVVFRDSALGVEMKQTCKGTKREIAKCRENVRKRFVASVACAKSGGTYAKAPKSGLGADWDLNQWSCGKKVLSREEACVQSGGVWGKPPSLSQGTDWSMNQKTCIKPEPSAQAPSIPGSADQGTEASGSASGSGY